MPREVAEGRGQRAEGQKGRKAERQKGGRAERQKAVLINLTAPLRRCVVARDKRICN